MSSQTPDSGAEYFLQAHSFSYETGPTPSNRDLELQLAEAALSQLLMLYAGNEQEMEERIERYESHLFEANRALGDYCIEEGIDDVVFVDKSARPIWNTLSEYLNLAHPDAAKPGFHFIDPHVLDEPISPIYEYSLSEYEKTKRKLLLRSKQDAAFSELVSTENDLIDKQGAKVLIVDACVHTGDSINNIKTLLESAGIGNIRTGALTDGSEIHTLPFKLDFSYTADEKALGCRPYGFDDGLMTGESIYAEPLHHPILNYQRHGDRTEDRRIIRERFGIQS